MCALGIVAEEASSTERLFAKFVSDHGKVYKTKEETAQRLAVFKSNLRKIEEMNAQYPGARFGVNKFADLSKEEFKNKILSKTPVIRDPSLNVAPEYPAEVIQAIPASFDWRPKGVVTPVKDQGQCGSCWSFSATGNIEGQWAIAKKKLVGLSEQNLVDCDHECMKFEDQQSCDSGCEGGLQPNAYEYVIKNKGIDTENSYPYQGVDGTCSFSTRNIGATIRNFTMISTDEDQMAAYLVNNGPIAIAANAEEWQFYIGGVFYLPCMTSLDHGILIVGYGTETDILDQTMPYWIIKNSWGADWGESGYIRVERGDGKCGVNLYASSSIV
jgi:cathepsin F